MREGELVWATLLGPMDSHDPGAGGFRLAVARQASTGTPAQRIGSLIFNPGNVRQHAVRELSGDDQTGILVVPAKTQR